MVGLGLGLVKVLAYGVLETLVGRQDVDMGVIRRIIAIDKHRDTRWVQDFAQTSGDLFREVH